MTQPPPTAPFAVRPGAGGLPAIDLVADDGARATVYLHGAHVTSWQPAGGGEQLFLSERTDYAARSAIRGGIPVIFPQFGPGALPRHGFARTAAWRLASAGRAASGVAAATFVLEADEATRALWPHDFRAEYSVQVGGPLIGVALGVANLGPAPLAFTAALHTYLRVADVATARLAGLRGVRYRDQAAGGAERVEEGEAVAVAGEVDRLYVDAPSPLTLVDGARRVEIDADGFPDVVVWNPWTAKGDALPDMTPGDYRRMLCVEAAAAARPITVPPGERWQGAQILALREP